MGPGQFSPEPKNIRAFVATLFDWVYSWLPSGVGIGLQIPIKFLFKSYKPERFGLRF